jgi:hypothetical protein
VYHIAVLRKGSIIAEIRDGGTGALLKNLSFFGAGFTPITAVALRDVDGDGTAELAVLSSRNSDGRNVVEIENAQGATSPSSVWFFPGATALQVGVIGEADGNGVPEIAMTSTKRVSC